MKTTKDLLTHMDPTEFDQANQLFRRFMETVAALRHPQHGCPWDLKQTHRSLCRYMLEEAYEAVDAMEDDDDQHLCEELGDVLLQVVLNAQLAVERKAFSLSDVVSSIDKKMRRRHPHVFESQTEKVSIDQVKRKWAEIKASEKAISSKLFGKDVEKTHPATSQSAKIGRIARSIGFDWKSSKHIFAKLEEEMDELKDALLKDDLKNAIKELGDVYFCLAQVCRHLDQDPEVIAQGGNKKFLRRFSILEQIAKEQKVDIKSTEAAILEKLWLQAKIREQQDLNKGSEGLRG